MEGYIMTKTKMNLHNNYKVKVVGSNGEIKDEGYAENIVLNGFWSRVDSSSYGVNQFNEIKIGSGSPEGDEVDPNRTTLYNQIGGRIQGTNPIVNSDLSGNIRISSKVMTHTIPATSEYSGEITEIGCGSNNYLNSLALFKDSEGNPISIYKSSEDVMIVEVTIYVIIEYAEDFIPLKDIDAISSIILGDGLEGIFYPSRPNRYRESLTMALTANKQGLVEFMRDLGLITEGGKINEVLKDNREVIYNKSRTSDTYGNYGFANYITSYTLGSVKLPNENYFSSYFIRDIEVGEGDGVKTEFNFPIPEFIVDTDEIMVDGVKLVRDIDYTLAHDNNSLAYPSSFDSMKKEYTIYANTNFNPFTYGSTNNGEAYITYEEDIYVDACIEPRVLSQTIVSYSTNGEDYLEAFRFAYGGNTPGRIVDLEEPIEAKYWKVEGRLFNENNGDALAFGKKPTHLVFTNPPAQGAKITATMQVDRPFKSDDFIFDASFKMSY